MYIPGNKVCVYCCVNGLGIYLCGFVSVCPCVHICCCGFSIVCVCRLVCGSHGMYMCVHKPLCVYICVCVCEDCRCVFVCVCVCVCVSIYLHLFVGFHLCVYVGGLVGLQACAGLCVWA